MAISEIIQTDNEPLIDVQNLSVTFGGQRALNDISLRLMPGEVHCLAGTNGCGKSTLIKVISGFISRTTVAKSHCVHNNRACKASAS